MLLSGKLRTSDLVPISLSFVVSPLTWGREMKSG